MTADTIDTTRLWGLIKDIKFAMFTCVTATASSIPAR
jgi:NifU-like protein involved in Fe-S cluster formation